MLNEQLSFLQTPPLCNRCNAEHDGLRCTNCGCPEFRLTGPEARELRAACKMKPKKRKVKK